MQIYVLVLNAKLKNSKYFHLLKAIIKDRGFKLKEFTILLIGCFI
jgi:hypothetical protein